VQSAARAFDADGDYSLTPDRSDDWYAGYAAAQREFEASSASAAEDDPPAAVED
jgi:hypothetical protein